MSTDMSYFPSWFSKRFKEVNIINIFIGRLLTEQEWRSFGIQ